MRSKGKWAKVGITGRAAYMKAQEELNREMSKVIYSVRRPTHGGAREGSGRKPTGRRGYTIRMKPETMRVLRKIAKPQGVGAWLDGKFGNEKVELRAPERKL